MRYFTRSSEMRQQLGGMAVKSGTAGQTLVSKAEAERRKLIEQAKADLAAKEQAIKVPAEVAEVVASKAKKAAKKATRKSGAKKPSLIDAINANPEPLNTAIRELVAEVVEAWRAERRPR